MAAPAGPAAARKLNPALSWARAPPATIVKPSTRPSGARFGAVSEGDELELGQGVEVSGNVRQTRCQCACVPKRCVTAFMGASTVSQRGWMIYDWADSIFVVASTLFIAPFISSLAEANGESDGRAFYSFVQSASTVASILAYVFLSGLGEFGYIKNTLARYGAIVGGISTTLFFVVISPEMVWLGAALFILARVCSRITGLMMDALLSDVSQGDDWVAHNVSAKAVALGYSGMLLFLVCVAPIVVAPSVLSLDSDSDKLWFEQRIPLGLCGIWWTAFSVVAFSWLDVYPGRPLPLKAMQGSKVSQLGWMVRTGVSEQYAALRTMFQFPDVGMFLLSWMFLSDASSTATSMAVLVADALGLSIVQQGAAAVVGLFAAGIGMTVYRFLVKQDFLTPFWALITNIAMLTVSICFVPFVTEAWQVYIIAGVAGLNVGSVASFTRSILSTMIPDGMQSNFFAVYELTQKGTSWIGPLVIGAVTSALGDSSDSTFVNVTVVTIVAEVVIGAPLFFCVNVRRGQQLAVDYAARRDGRSTESPMSLGGDAASVHRASASPALGEHITKSKSDPPSSPLAAEEGNPGGHLLEGNTASDATSVSGPSMAAREMELSSSGLPIPKANRGGSASNTPSSRQQGGGQGASSPRLSMSAPGAKHNMLQAQSSQPDAAVASGAGGVLFAAPLDAPPPMADTLPPHVTSAAHFNTRPNSISAKPRVADSTTAPPDTPPPPPVLTTQASFSAPSGGGMDDFKAKLADDIKLRAGGAPTPRSVFRRPQSKRAPSLMVDDSASLYPDISPMRAATLPSKMESALTPPTERKGVPSGSMGPVGASTASNGPTSVRSPLNLRPGQ